MGKKHLKYILILVVLSYCFFVLGNSILSLTSPDEVFYTQIAKEMAQHKTWMVPYMFGQPNFEKPIFTYWLLRLGFVIFGITNFGARFFPAFFAGLGVIAVYLLAFLGYRNQKKAFICALILLSGGLYIGLARTVFTDMIFSVFILLSLLSFFWGYVQKERKAIGILLFFIFSSLAVLTKGPLGLYLPFLVILFFLISRRDLRFLSGKVWLWGFLIFAILSLPWYMFIFKKYGMGFIREFFYNDHFRRIIQAEHTGNDKWYFYPLSMVGCIFPWSLYVLAALFALPKQIKRHANPIYVFSACWVMVVLVSFQIAHSKLVSYILPLFPALALITGDFIHDKLLVNKPHRLALCISLVNLLVIFLVPLALSVSLIIHPKKVYSYLPSQAPVYYLIVLSLGLFVAMLIFILTHKLSKFVYALSLIIPLFISSLPLLKDILEPYISSKQACEYLLNNYQVNNTILCSKAFVRGVRFHTDKDTAVISIPGNPFFSPHPIPFLNSDEKALDFLLRQPTTYCILSKTYIDDISRLVGQGIKFTILKIIGNEYIVKVERL